MSFLIKKKQSISSLLEYADNSSFISWDMEPEMRNFNNLPEVKYRNHFVDQKFNEGLNEILKIYIKITLTELENLISNSLKFLGLSQFHGYGVELGSGTGAFASMFCKLNPSVKKIFAVEICDRFPKTIIPEVSKKVLNTNFNKVLPILGSFNNLMIKNNELDFIIEMGSLHHSNNLSKSFSEISRTLKSKGKLLAFDRCHSNTLSDEKVKEMLDLEYDNNFLVSHGYPSNIKLTRRQNGEHEYRLFEWRKASEDAGMKLVRIFSTKKINLKRFVKGILSLFPDRFTKKFYKTHDSDLKTSIDFLRNKLNVISNKNSLDTVLIGEKDFTVFLWEKI